MLLRRLRALALLATLGAFTVAFPMLILFVIDAVRSNVTLTAPMLPQVALLFGVIGAVAGIVLGLAMLAFARADSVDHARRGRVAAAGAVAGLVVLLVMFWAEGGLADPVRMLTWQVAAWTAVFVAGGAAAATALLAVARRARLSARDEHPELPEPPERS